MPAMQAFRSWHYIRRRDCEFLTWSQNHKTQIHKKSRKGPAATLQPRRTLSLGLTESAQRARTTQTAQGCGEPQKSQRNASRKGAKPSTSVSMQPFQNTTTYFEVRVDLKTHPPKYKNMMLKIISINRTPCFHAAVWGGRGEKQSNFHKTVQGATQPHSGAW